MFFCWYLYDFISMESCHLQTVIVLLLSLQFGFLLFIFLLIAVPRTSNTILKENSKIGYPCLVPQRKYFQLFTIECDINCRTVMYCISLVEGCSLYGELCSPTLLRGFNHNWILHMIKSFFCNYSDNHMLCMIWFANVVYHINWFANIYPSLHPWEKSCLIMLYDPFNILLNLDY